jgi:hypothetical protein
MAEDFILHPCVISVAYMDGPRGPAINVIYQHRVRGGKCEVCNDPIIFMHGLATCTDWRPENHAQIS